MKIFHIRSVDDKEGQRIYQMKCCVKNNKDGDNSLKNRWNKENTSFQNF